MEKRLLRVADVAKFLDVSERTVYNVVRQGKIRCYRVGENGGAIRFAQEDVEAYVAERAVGVAQLRRSHRTASRDVPRQPAAYIPDKEEG